MNLWGFDKIASNCDILIYIYKLLNFRDQLRLSRASVQLRSTFERFIWREKYGAMRIIYDYGDVIVKGELGSNLLKLKAHDVSEFFQHYGDNVLDLTVKNFSMDMKSFTTVRLRNLKTLRYIDVRLSDKHVQLMPLHYPRLQELYVYSSGGYNSLPAFGSSILSLKALSQMKNLRRLSDESSKQSVIPYEHFYRAINELKLQSLQLSAALKPDKRFRAKEETVGTPKNLRQLVIDTSFDRHKWSNNFSSFLSHFTNLVSLSIRFSDVLTDAILLTLNETCVHLKKFIIRQTIFASIKSFSVPAKVRHLALEECENVTGDILKQMLTQLKINKFSAKSTYFKKMQNFKISPFIQSLDIDGVKMHKFKSAYEGNTNLKALTWRGSLYWDNDDHLATTDDNSLATCCNLEVLDIKSGSVPMSVLLQLKSLHTVAVSLSMALLSWSYITSLLKHSSLRNFAIIDHVICSPLLVDSDIPDGGFVTHIDDLTIPFSIFREGLHFWLDLFRRNGNLTLRCSNFEDFGDYDRFIKTLIAHEYFPSELRTIEVWGCTISCNDIRKRFRLTMTKLNWELRYAEHNLNYEIVLCRKKQ